jgi:hypothetical protein
MTTRDLQYVRIQKFKPETIVNYKSILFAGPMNSGKSFCARSMAYYIRNNVYDATVFSGTKEIDHPWSQYIPEEFVYNGFDENILGAIMHRQKRRKEIADTHGVSIPSHLIVFEDLEYRKKNIFESEAARQVMLNGRHVKTIPIVIIQYIMRGLTLEVRSMFDLAFFTKEPSLAVRKKIYMVFGGVCKTFDEFDNIFRMCTEDNRVLVIKLRENSYNISDTLFHFKATDMGKFRIGHPDFWLTSDEIKRSVKEIARQQYNKASVIKRDKLDSQDRSSENNTSLIPTEKMPIKPPGIVYAGKSGRIFELAKENNE